LAQAVRVLRLERFSHEPAGLGDLWSDRIGIGCESGRAAR
jgi:hypothetical protein